MTPMSDPKSSTGSEGGFFEIRVRGHLDSYWSDWFEGLEMTLLEDGETMLSGHIPDQAALMGVLIKLNRLNLALQSINQIEEKNQLEKE